MRLVPLLVLLALTPGDCPPPPPVLNVESAAGGSVGIAPMGLACLGELPRPQKSGATVACTRFEVPTVVDLTATPDAGFRFVTWHGVDGCSEDPVCPVPVDGTTSVLAIFELITPQFFPTEVLVGRRNIVYLWDGSLRGLGPPTSLHRHRLGGRWMAPIVLEPSALWIAYDWERDRIYVAHTDGRITRIEATHSTAQDAFLDLDAPIRAIGMAGENLFVVLADEVRVFDPDGALLSQRVDPSLVPGFWFTYDPARERLYFSSFLAPPLTHTLHWVELDEGTGAMGPGGQMALGTLPSRIYPSPDGSTIHLGAGATIDLDTLEVRPHPGGGSVSALWLGDELLTLGGPSGGARRRWGIGIEFLGGGAPFERSSGAGTEFPGVGSPWPWDRTGLFLDPTQTGFFPNPFGTTVPFGIIVGPWLPIDGEPTIIVAGGETNFGRVDFVWDQTPSRAPLRHHLADGTLFDFREYPGSGWKLLDTATGIWVLTLEGGVPSFHPHVPHPDADGDGVPTFEDAFPTDPAASVDSDGDGAPDDWNPGRDETDSTRGLVLDAFPDDPECQLPEHAFPDQPDLCDPEATLPG